MDNRCAKVGRDDGWILFSVTLVITILFIVVTMLLTAATQHAFEASKFQARNKAMHVADAGVNAYVHELARTGEDFIPRLGPVDMGDGSTWEVEATRAEYHSVPIKPLTVTSVGTIPSLGVTRTVVAEIRQPSFADYQIVSHVSLTLDSESVMNGSVRTNGDLSNAGSIAGRAEAHKEITGSGTFRGGEFQETPAIDFASIGSDIEKMYGDARESGSGYYRATDGVDGNKGYQVTLSGSQVLIDKVSNVDIGTGELTTQPEATISAPSSGVLCFDDTVWVSGEYSCALTIVANNIYIIDNVESSPGGQGVLGLIARHSVIVPSWREAMPEDLVIQAALLAANGTTRADLIEGRIKRSLTIIGSQTTRDGMDYVRFSPEGEVIAGFRERTYTYDPRLAITPPPMYPRIKDGSYKVSSWLEG
ncbi:MAG: hypothetical protein FWE94_02940 [Coriobacteriia bacterium]|nr:hypothetical protein [Coriobacteriia bacterium]